MNPSHLPNLASPRFKANPYPLYARLRAEAPVCRTILPDRRVAWLVTRYDDALLVLKDARFVKDRRNALAPGGPARQPWMPEFMRPLAQNMLDLDAPAHPRLRALVHKAFTPRRIEQLRERIQTLCDTLLTTAQPDGSIDLIRDYALPIPTTIIAELLGVPPADRARFHAWSKRIVAIATLRDFLVALPATWQFVHYLRRLVRQRRAQPQDDLVSALVQAEEAGDTLSEDELLALIFILLVAGHETTVNLIGSGTLALLEHPEQRDRLKQNPALLGPAVEELLRYTSPIDMATERYAREDITLGGATIPRGNLVLAVLGSANRDERQFPNPDTLDLGRDPNRHLAFGQGAHYCVGAPLARLEAQLSIQTLLHRAPNLALTGATDALQWRRGLFLRGLEHLPLAL